MIVQIPHPTYPDKVAYVVPILDGRIEKNFWIGVDLGHHERVAASKGVSLEDHVLSLVRHYFPDVVIPCEDAGLSPA